MISSLPVSDRGLDALRSVGDPDFDLAARQAIDSVGARETLRGLLQNNEAVVPAGVPRGLRECMLASAWAPLELDLSRASRAVAHFATHAETYAFLLGTTSLLECFAARYGAKAVHLGRGLLRGGAAHRIGRTASFVLDVTTPRGLMPGSSGRGAIARVRARHAIVRNVIVHERSWRAEVFGAPLCQEDMIGALLCFAHSPLMKMRRLGLHAPPSVVEDSLHLWRAVGAALGIRVEHVPDDEPMAAALGSRIRDRQLGPSAEGVELARAVIETYSARLPSAALRASFLALVQRLVGDEVSQALELPAPEVGQLAVNATLWLWRHGAAFLRILPSGPRRAVLVRQAHELMSPRGAAHTSKAGSV
jgi:ER-bound oxygenase mpaB/B'/Rubber oxygenase, catalytic domain